MQSRPDRLDVYYGTELVGSVHDSAPIVAGATIGKMGRPGASPATSALFSIPQSDGARSGAVSSGRDAGTPPTTVEITPVLLLGGQVAAHASNRMSEIVATLALAQTVRSLVYGSTDAPCYRCFSF